MLELSIIIIASIDHVQRTDGSAVADPLDCRPTPEDILGPYYWPPHPPLYKFCTRVPDSDTMETLYVHGYVYESDCVRPVRRTFIDIWQADHSGNYTRRSKCKGRLRTDRYGYYEYSTIRPGKYSINPRHPVIRPAHIHYKVYGRQGHKDLVTQMYFSGDTNLGPHDGCSICKSEETGLVADVTRYCRPLNDRDCISIARFDIVMSRD